MLEENKYLLVVINASNIAKDLSWIKNQNSFGCMIDNQSENYSLLAVQGPKSIDLLQEITNINLSEIQYYNFKIGEICGIDNVILSRTGYTGELGFELYVKMKMLKNYGKPLFLTSIHLEPIGLAAAEHIKIRKRFLFVW